MSDEIQIGGVGYVSSKRASHISGYAQDYIGQLCRAGLIQAQRIGGLWYLTLDSLYRHKQKADSYVPSVPRRDQAANAESLVSFDGKDYISAARAAEITGYHKDYVGQLARESVVLSRQVGSRWYVERDSILAHKRTKDALLAKVQAEAVGIRREDRNDAVADTRVSAEPFFTYSRDDSDLLPILEERTADTSDISASRDDASRYTGRIKIPIHKMRAPIKMLPILDYKQPVKHVKLRTLRVPGKSIFYAASAAFALTVVIMLSVGYVSLGSRALYAQNPVSDASTALAAEAVATLDKIGDFLERIFVTEHVYRRALP